MLHWKAHMPQTLVGAKVLIRWESWKAHRSLTLCWGLEMLEILWFSKSPSEQPFHLASVFWFQPEVDARLLGGPSPGEWGTAVFPCCDHLAAGPRPETWSPCLPGPAPALRQQVSTLQRARPSESSVPGYVLWPSPPWKVFAVRTLSVIFVILAQLSSRDPGVCYRGENYLEKLECLSTNINHYPMGWRYFFFWVLILEISPSLIAHCCEAVSLCFLFCVCVYWEGV